MQLVTFLKISSLYLTKDFLTSPPSLAILTKIGIKSNKAVSYISSPQKALIIIPFSFCNLKFYGILSTIIILSKGLPILVRSLTKSLSIITACSLYNL